MSEKLSAGQPMPRLTLLKAGGGEVRIGEGAAETGGWQMVVAYRGRHCPICKRYFARLNDLLDGYAEANVDVVAVSCDPQEKAEADVKEGGWRFPVGYGLSLDDARRLGLYVSKPRSPEETDRPFTEPGLFVVNPEGKTHIIDISNAPFARPDLEGVLNGLKFIQAKNYPIRGTVE